MPLYRSCEVALRKPDPKIWQLAMGIAQVTPAQCVYFDDRIMFVRAAEKLGIKAYQHTSLEATKKNIGTIKKRKSQ